MPRCSSDMSSHNQTSHVCMPRCSSGTSSENEEEMFIFSVAAQRTANISRTCSEFMAPSKHKRAPKVDRSASTEMKWQRTDWDEHVACKLECNEWWSTYHMKVADFDALHDLLFQESAQQVKLSKMKALASTPMGGINTRCKLAAALREMFGEKQKSMVDIFKFSPTSARAGFDDVVRRINTCPDLELQIFDTDHSTEVLDLRALGFQGRSSYPSIFRHAIGAIDGLFITTEQPEAAEVGNVRTYWSGHKKAFGLNMQGVCDASCKFIGFACNTPGSTNDYVAFRHSNFYGTWPNVPEPYYYLGDCAYPLAPYCLTPFVGTSLPAAQDVFNFYHSQLRITIERAFGIFVNVFRIFHSPLQCSIAKCCEIVEACVRLHNFRITRGCQLVSRQASTGAIYRTALDHGNDAFDVLDDYRYMSDRPHAFDAPYARYVELQEQAHAPQNAAKGAGRRDVLAKCLANKGAVRPV